MYAEQKLNAQNSHFPQPPPFFLTHLKFEIEGLQQQQRIRKILMAYSFQILLNCRQPKY